MATSHQTIRLLMHVKRETGADGSQIFTAVRTWLEEKVAHEAELIMQQIQREEANDRGR